MRQMIQDQNMSISKFSRLRASEVLDNLKSGQGLVLSSRNKPQVVVMDLDAYLALEQQIEEFRQPPTKKRSK